MDLQLNQYVQCTMSMILLLTVGGTPFDAMHRYAPICRRFTLVMLNTGPSTLATESMSENTYKHMILYSTQTPLCIYVDKILRTVLKQFVKYFDYKHI